jgi:hypothetical protein
MQSQNLKHVKMWFLIICVVALGVTSLATVNTASAHGWCVAGNRYGDAGTAHNYVEFQVNFSANSWHTHRAWWAYYPIGLWANPDGNGIARAGIQGTDNNPPYGPDGYQLCGL